MLAGASGATALGARAQARPIRIGVVNDSNGIYSDNGGVDCVIATRMATAEIDHTLLGRPIGILRGDCADKPDLAASITREWIDSQGVDLIVDGANSAAGLAIQQVTKEKERIYIPIGPATSELTVKACSPFCFHFAYDTYALAELVQDWVERTIVGVLGLLALLMGLGQVLGRYVHPELGFGGGQVVVHILIWAIMTAASQLMRMDWHVRPYLVLRHRWVTS